MLGGGMRQTGWLAACGLAALSDENIARLRKDHENARLLALMESRGVFATKTDENTLRFVTSRRVTGEDVRYAVGVMGEIMRAGGE